MMQHLLAAMRNQAMLAANGRAVTRHGIVDSYDPNAYAVKVRIQPEDVITGWMPVLSPWVGNGWGLFAPPTAGDLVEVCYAEDDPDVGYVAQRFYSDTDRPLPAPSGEFWLVHKSGSLLKFLNNGDVQVVSQRDLIANAGRDLNATVVRNANVNVGGDLAAAITGAAGITVGGNATATISGSASVKANGGVTIDGAGAGSTKGIVQGDCVCAFTGMPHAMISGTVKGSG